jgi:hypothetical protein
MNDPSKFLRFLTIRPGYDFTEPYGFYTVPLKNNLCLKCFLSAGESIDEEGWVHLSVMVRQLPNDREVAMKRSFAGYWRKRLPSPIELKYARLLFFREDEWVAQYHPPSSFICPLDRKQGDLIIHLWGKRPDSSPLEIPPNFLLESLNRLK